MDGPITNRRVVLLIPAYQPGETLPDMVRGVLDAGAGDPIESVVVVDDGSGPESAPVFSRLAALPGVTLLRHAVNLGKGAALKTGFNHALLAWPELAGVVTADADGQHGVEDIVNVARRLAAHPDEIVLGVRGFTRNVPMRSRLGNWITRYVFRVFTGLRVADTQTGLRGWPAAVCRASLPVAINGYDFELECLIKANHEHGASVVQVPIQTIYLDGNRSSHFNPVRDSLRIYFVFIRYCGASILAAIIDSLTFYLTYRAAGNLVISQVAGRCLAVVVAFLLARNVVFRSNASVASSLTKYLTLVAVMGVISYSMLSFLSQRAHMPVLAAKMTAEGLLFLANFTIQRQLVFTRNRASAGEA